MTIFDFITSHNIAAYWEVLRANEAPFMGEELFPTDKKLGLKLDWIKGAQGLPVVLAPSQFDTTAKNRARAGFDKLSANMPFFKESMYIDEELRQQLNMVIESGKQGYIDAVVNRIFADNVTLIRAAAARREQMRMMALTTGVVSCTANGMNYSYDYQVPEAHKVEADVSWATASTDIISDIRTGMDTVEDDTGVRPSRAVCSRKTWGYLLRNTAINKSVFVLSAGAASLSDARLKQYLMDELGLEVVVNNSKYKNDAGTAAQYVPDDTFVLFPAGKLGTTWFGTTPEESDLLASAVANVAITDTGVAITSTEKTDPVTIDTKVTMISLPSFEAADQIYIMDVIPAAAG